MLLMVIVHAAPPGRFRRCLRCWNSIEKTSSVVRYTPFSAYDTQSVGVTVGGDADVETTLRFPPMDSRLRGNDGRDP